MEISRKHLCSLLVHSLVNRDLLLFNQSRNVIRPRSAATRDLAWQNRAVSCGQDVTTFPGTMALGISHSSYLPRRCVITRDRTRRYSRASMTIEIIIYFLTNATRPREGNFREKFTESQGN
jgi:hypothetical protein